MQLTHSQNYINSHTLVNDILKLVDFTLADTILEIGPGKGIITDALLKQHKKIIAVEADQKNFLALQKKYGAAQNLILVHADILHYSLPNEPFITISNIPFNITADIVRKLTDKKSNVTAAYLIMQKEAAVKFLGAPNAHSPLLSHFLNINFEMKLLMDIGASQYNPQPHFDTALISFRKRKHPIFDSHISEQFRDFLVYVFEQRKPRGKDALKRVVSNLQAKIILENLHIPGGIGIKEILFAEWVSIFKVFLIHASQKSKEKIYGCYQKLLAEQSQLNKVHRTRKD